MIKKEDDTGEVLFKLNEQMLVMNKYMEEMVMTQLRKRESIYEFEKKMLKTEDYQYFVDELEKQDAKLYEVSNTFSSLTSRTKKLLEEIQVKS